MISKGASVRCHQSWHQVGYRRNRSVIPFHDKIDLARLEAPVGTDVGGARGRPATGVGCSLAKRQPHADLERAGGPTAVSGGSATPPAAPPYDPALRAESVRRPRSVRTFGSLRWNGRTPGLRSSIATLRLTAAGSGKPSRCYREAAGFGASDEQFEICQRLHGLFFKRRLVGSDD